MFKPCSQGLLSDLHSIGQLLHGVGVIVELFFFLLVSPACIHFKHADLVSN